MSNNLLHDYIAGAIGGTAGIIVGHPFDTVKVQLQTHKHVGNWGCIKTVWRAGVDHQVLWERWITSRDRGNVLLICTASMDYADFLEDFIFKL
ncbi:solute carrier family 25 member 47-like isoform X3 [Tubulanus polymorphus]|uniref:solute carrier family 25 member 47-like isoform X3 n=1 Tax=Tubulanus polymorphus TaxID=672921 RepID=UPI003DA6C65C